MLALTHCAVTFSENFRHSQRREVFTSNLVYAPSLGELLNLRGLYQPALTANKEGNWSTDFGASVN